jgi:hypothetical protein
MLLDRETSLSSGGDYDIDSKTMPLLCWEERRGTAYLHHPMWRTTTMYHIVSAVNVLFPKQAYPLAHLKTPIALVMQVRATLTEGVGINAATRLYGVSKNSIYRWQERLSGLKKRYCCLP